MILLSRRRLLAGLGATGIGISVAAKSVFKPTKTQLGTKHTIHTHASVSDGEQYFTNIELTNHHGQTLKFYDDLIKDKFVVINMMYAQCSEGICPISTYNLKKVHQALGGRVGQDIHFYSISLDSVHDTPNVLNRYAQSNQTGKGWQFLTGSYDDIEVIRHRLGFFDHDPVVDQDRANHAGIIRIGSDQYQQWLMAPALGNYKSILQVINHAYKSPKSIFTSGVRHV